MLWPKDEFLYPGNTGNILNSLKVNSLSVRLDQRSRSSGEVADQLSGRYPLDWQGEGNVWEAFRRTCEPGSPARHLFSASRASSTSQVRLSQLESQSDELTFARSTSGNFSYCQNPWAHYSQGHFFSDWRTICALFPIFSPAKASGYLDIRVPSHYYHGQTRRYTYGWDPVNLELHHVDHMETPWDMKSDKVFWRGASTGGGSSPPGFADRYQRHRYVSFTTAPPKLKLTCCMKIGANGYRHV